MCKVATTVLVLIAAVFAGLSASAQSSASLAAERAALKQLQRDAYTTIIRADLARDEKRFDDAVELYVAALDMWGQLADRPDVAMTPDTERNAIHCRNELKSLLIQPDLKQRYGEKLRDRLIEPPPRVPAVSAAAEPSAPPVQPANSRYKEDEMRQELERLRLEMFEATRREAIESQKRNEADVQRREREAEKARASRESDEARRQAELSRKQSEAAKREAAAARKQKDTALRDTEEAMAAAESARKQLDEVNRKFADLQKQKRELERKLSKMGEAEQTAESARSEKAAAEKLLDNIDKENRGLVAEKNSLQERVDQLEDSLAASKGGQKSAKKPGKAPTPPPVAPEPVPVGGSPAVARARPAVKDKVELANDARVADDLKTADAVAAEGMRLMREGQNDKAYELVMFGLAKSPENPQLQIMLGNLFVQSGRFKDAVNLMSPIVAGEQGSAKSRVVLGAAYFGLGRYNEARVELEMAMGLDPDLREAHYNFAQLLLYTNPPDPVRAKRHYNDALALGAEPDPVLEVAIEKAMAGAKKK